MKNRKTIYILFLFCLYAFSMLAQGGRESLYIQLYGGVNKSANENLPFSELSRYPIAGGAFVGVGNKLSPFWGWRVAFGYNHNKSRNVKPCESKEPWVWDDSELFGDLTFDVIDAIRKSSAQSSFGLKAFAGLGGLWTFNFPKQIPLSYVYSYSKDSKLNLGFRLGLTASWRLSSSTSLGVELSQTLIQDPFNGVVDHRAPLDGRTNLSVGMTWMLNSRKLNKKRAPIVYANKLRETPFLPLAVPQKETGKHRSIEGKAYLDFPVNETVIYSSYRNNAAELQKIKTSIEQVRFDNSVVITSVSLHGYASPESSYYNNERLAKGRTKALAEYLKNEYQLTSIDMETRYTPEDWEHLRLFVSDSLITKNRSLSIYRTDLLRVIDSDLKPDDKEEELKRVGDGKPYQWLHQYVYPALRHTDYSIVYTIKEYPIGEARRLIYTHPEALSLDEIYRVAVSYPEDADGRFDALQIGAQQYPDSEVANLNAACACIRRRKLKDARALAMKVGNTSDSNYILNVIDAMEGKVDWHLNNKKVMVDAKK